MMRRNIRDTTHLRDTTNIIIDCDTDDLYEKLIVKDNKLVNACYNLSLVEMRIINLAMAKKGKKPANKKFLVVSAEDYAKVFNVHRNTAYEAIESARKTLFDKQFSYFINEPDGSITNFTSRWVYTIGTNDTQHKLYLSFNPNVLDMISNTDTCFTAYRLKETTGLSSAYSLKLYEIIMSYSAMKTTRYISISDLKFRLGISETEYPKIQDFKKRVLHPAIDEINEKTNLAVEYMDKTKGRKIISIGFICTQKEKKEQQSAVNMLKNLRNDIIESKPKREKMTISQIVSKHPQETIGKSERDVYKMFGSKYQII